MFKKALMKMSVIGIIGAAFMACGVVDVEQAQGVVDLRARILEIQTKQVDPLVEQINAIEEQVAPIEAEIEALERQKEELYREAEGIGQQFDDEMRERFDTTYMEGDQARQEFENEIQERHRELEEKERSLHEEQQRLHDEIEEANQEKRQAIEDAGQDTWEALEFEMRAKEEEAQKVSKSMWRAWDDERDEAQQQVENLRREFEENNPFNMEMEAIHQAWKDIDDLYFEIDVEQMQIEEARMELHDMMRPLEEQAQQLRREKRDIQEMDPSTFARIAGTSSSGQNSNEMIKEQHEKLDDLRRQLREAIDEQQQTQTAPRQLNWDDHGRKTEEIWADYEARTEEIALKRAQASDTTGAAGDASMAQAALDEININFQDQLAFQEAKLLQAMESLQAFETGAAANDGSALRSQLIANIEGMRSEVNEHQNVMDSLPANLQDELGNPEYHNISGQLADAESALANTPETNTVDTTNADGTTTAQTVENPVYAGALASVENLKAQLANIPEFILGEPYANPSHLERTISIGSLNQEISILEAELNTLSDQPTSADPAYTAALAEKNSLDSLIHETREQWDAEVAAKQNIIDAGSGGAPDQGQLDAEIQDLMANAEADRDNALAALDAEFTVTEATNAGNSGGRAEEIRDEIENIENYISDLHNSKDQGRQAKNQAVENARSEVREIEEQMEGMHNFMRELEDQQRPLHEKRMALDKERMVLEQKQREIEDQRGPWEEERHRYEEDLWSGFDDWQRTRQREIEDQQEAMWELVRVDMDQNRRDTEVGMKQMWKDFENESRDSHKGADREFKEKRKAIDQERRELEENRDNLGQAFEAEREEAIQEIENMRDELYEERMAPIEEEIAYLDDEIGAKFASIEGLYQQQEDLAGQLEDLEAQVRELDQEAEFGLLSVISGAIDNAEKLEQNPASLAGAAGVSLTDFLPSPPSRE